MKIRALVPFSTGTITMEQYEIREVSDAVGAKLVAAKLVTEISGGGGGSNALVVTDTDGTLDKTWQEIYDALPFAVLDIPSLSTRKIFEGARTDLHGLQVTSGDYYAANSASGYPEKTTGPK